jgi:hypothetical protein
MADDSRCLPLLTRPAGLARMTMTMTMRGRPTIPREAAQLDAYAHASSQALRDSAAARHPSPRS